MLRNSGEGASHCLVSPRNARAEAAELRVKELERQCAEAEAKRPVSLSLQIHPQLQRGGMAHARTQTPIVMRDQISVSTQAPLPQEAAAAAKQQRQHYQQLEERAPKKACDALVPALERGVAAAEAAERAAAQQQQDAQRMLEAVRPTAERAACEAAAAAADREAVREERARLSVTQSELASLRVVAALAEEERARGEGEVVKARERISWLERAEKHLRDELGGVREAYDMSHNEWMAALDRLWTERSVYKGALKELEEHGL